MLYVVDALTSIEYHLIVGLLKLPMEPGQPGRRPNVNALARAPDRVSCISSDTSAMCCLACTHGMRPGRSSCAESHRDIVKRQASQIAPAVSNVGSLILPRHGSPLRTLWIHGPEDESFQRGLRRHEACSPKGRLMVSLSMRGRDIWSGPTPEEP
jgi:hypothetical protein